MLISKNQQWNEINNESDWEARYDECSAKQVVSEPVESVERLPVDRMQMQPLVTALSIPRVSRPFKIEGFYFVHELGLRPSYERCGDE